MEEREWQASYPFLIPSLMYKTECIHLRDESKSLGLRSRF